MGERTVVANGVRIRVESFGDPADPPLLLVMGNGASMLWWDEGFCRTLAGGGRFVVRYDQRDTGRSVTYPVGRPGYTGADLVDDAAGVLDAYGLPAAHVMGVSGGGGVAQLLALDHPGRVLSLVLMSTTAAVPDGGGRELPPPSEEFGRFVATARVDWTDEASVVDHLVAYERVLTGTERPFDEAAARDLVRRDVARARDFPAVQNHDLLSDGAGDGSGSDGRHRSRGSLSSIAVPTLVVHGTADPLFPVEHGSALAERIPGAGFLPLTGAGHGLHRPDLAVVARAVLAHTGRK
ncbi:alpha/beta fold hydrolase [Streptomyces longispororuber]|uniref:alpha/beta fold hydrolase n=1 Tax=Streptomyces longispororuber TaxID=68230 RepID=UPI00210A2EC3|nr:alpha/beta hydrolase [Streptomyces longispororuber]MCQ4211088.1 alpha/beta fold hydrolase [Streptomyces longispororuber]